MEYDFAGVKSISILAQTVDLNDYKRSGKNRFGTPVEMQDHCAGGRAYRTRDFNQSTKANNVDQMNTKGCGEDAERTDQGAGGSLHGQIYVETLR